MKLISFSCADHRSAGVLLPDGSCLDLPVAGPLIAGAESFPACSSLDDMLQDWERSVALAHLCIRALGAMSDADMDLLTHAGALMPPGKVRVLAPLLHPSKIIAVGLNYRDHLHEAGAKLPRHPVIFAKLPTSVIGTEAVIHWDPELTMQVDYEAELGIVISKRTRGVSAEEAEDCIAGYTAINDVSARDLQFEDRQWVRAKSLDTFCPMGPALVTTEEILSPENLSIECLVNGRVQQKSNTREMIFGIPELVAFISRGITLLPGDVISTGTPGGVGAFRQPPVFLQDGDEVIVRIEGIGDLVNRVSLTTDA